jgi:hypothetical protein
VWDIPGDSTTSDTHWLPSKCWLWLFLLGWNFSKRHLKRDYKLIRWFGGGIFQRQNEHGNLSKLFRTWPVESRAFWQLLPSNLTCCTHYMSLDCNNQFQMVTATIHRYIIYVIRTMYLLPLWEPTYISILIFPLMISLFSCYLISSWFWLLNFS